MNNPSIAFLNRCDLDWTSSRTSKVYSIWVLVSQAMFKKVIRKVIILNIQRIHSSAFNHGIHIIGWWLKMIQSLIIRFTLYSLKPWPCKHQFSTSKVTCVEQMHKWSRLKKHCIHITKAQAIWHLTTNWYCCLKVAENKKFGPAQNILGPVKGQSVSLLSLVLQTNNPGL